MQYTEQGTWEDSPTCPMVPWALLVEGDEIGYASKRHVIREVKVVHNQRSTEIKGVTYKPGMVQYVTIEFRDGETVEFDTKRWDPKFRLFAHWGPESGELENFDTISDVTLTLTINAKIAVRSGSTRIGEQRVRVNREHLAQLSEDQRDTLAKHLARETYYQDRLTEHAEPIGDTRLETLASLLDQRKAYVEKKEREAKEKAEAEASSKAEEKAAFEREVTRLKQVPIEDLFEGRRPHGIEYMINVVDGIGDEIMKARRGATTYVMEARCSRCAYQVLGREEEGQAYLAQIQEKVDREAAEREAKEEEEFQALGDLLEIVAPTLVPRYRDKVLPQGELVRVLRRMLPNFGLDRVQPDPRCLVDVGEVDDDTVMTQLEHQHWVKAREMPLTFTLPDGTECTATRELREYGRSSLAGYTGDCCKVRECGNGKHFRVGLVISGTIHGRRVSKVRLLPNKDDDTALEMYGPMKHAFGGQRDPSEPDVVKP